MIEKEYRKIKVGDVVALRLDLTPTPNMNCVCGDPFKKHIVSDIYHWSSDVKVLDFTDGCQGFSHAMEQWEEEVDTSWVGRFEGVGWTWF